MSDLIIEDFKDSILKITLNNPNQQNTLSLEFINDLKRIIENADNEDTILIVGHNPGIHELSLSLTNNNPDLMVEFSTCSMSFISFDNDNWFDFDTNKCLLEKFIRPKDLKTNH